MVALQAFKARKPKGLSRWWRCCGQGPELGPCYNRGAEPHGRGAWLVGEARVRHGALAQPYLADVLLGKGFARCRWAKRRWLRRCRRWWRPNEPALKVPLGGEGFNILFPPSRSSLSALRRRDDGDLGLCQVPAAQAQGQV